MLTVQCVIQVITVITFLCFHHFGCCFTMHCTSG